MCILKTDSEPKVIGKGVLKRFLSEKKGVAAIEFAFIAPMLVILYLGSMEMGQAIETNRKIGRTSSMIGDLVTQQSSVTKNTLDAIMQVGQSVIRPYNRSKMKITVTSINIDASGIAKETWQRTMAEDGTTSGNSTLKMANPPVPSQLLAPNTSVVRVETATTYKWMLTYNEAKASVWGAGSFYEGIPLKETSYTSPRISTSGISCGDC